MSKKEDVCDLLMKIRAEGVSYYFTSYTSGERAEEDALKAGVAPELAAKLRDAGERLEQAERDAEATMKEIGASFGLTEEDYEY